MRCLFSFLLKENMFFMVIVLQIASLSTASSRLVNDGLWHWSMNEKRTVEEQLNDQKATSDRIIDYVLNGKGKHQTWNRLANMTDKFGYR